MLKNSVLFIFILTLCFAISSDVNAINRTSYDEKDVIRVTNLKDSGKGSLRWAVEQDFPRLIKFQVGGYIKLKSPLEVRSPQIKIDGLSAPHPGITLKGSLVISTSDVLIQHLRVRPGWQGSRDGVRIHGPNIENIVLDHLSVTWATDENISTYLSNNNIVISNCIIANGLTFGSSYGVLIGKDSKNFLLYGNLIANNKDRNPLILGRTSGMIINNLIYNDSGAPITIHGVDGASILSVIGNIYINGPNTKKGKALIVNKELTKGSVLYEKDNVHPEKIRQGSEEFYKETSPFKNMELFIFKSDELKDYIFSNVGARPRDRDTIDKEIIDGVKKQSLKFIKKEKGK